MSSNIQNEVKIYLKRLESIISHFNMHRKEIELMPDSIEGVITKIKNVFDKIKQDRENIRRIISDIENDIKYLLSQKNASKKGLIVSGALGIASTIGGLVTCNVPSLIYGVSSISSVVSGYFSATNILNSNIIIKELENILNHAMDEEKKIDNEIKKLIDILRYKESLIPNYIFNKNF